MELALELASRGRLTCAPNPMVGCLVVASGEVVGFGWHEVAGGPHAEVVALHAAGPAARGATAYVTLEPCTHFGRTPPCVPALLQAGIARVVVGLRDPFPQVAGSGMRQLAEAGVQVDRAPRSFQERCARQNFQFLHRVSQGGPFVTMKFAMTLDGKIATSSGHARWISSPASRDRAHLERAAHRALLVGVGTVLADDPGLDCRRPGGRNPVPVVLDGALRTPPAARLLRGGQALLACRQDADPGRARRLQQAGAEILRLPGRDRVSLRDLLPILGARGLDSVLIEGGGQVHASALAEGVVHRVLGFVAPLMVGGQQAPTPVEGPGVGRLEEGWQVRHLAWQPVGPDLMCEGFLWDWSALVQ